MITFVQFLKKQGFEASSYVDENVKGEVLVINGDTFLTKDIEKTPYFSLYRTYLASQKTKE